MNRCLAIVSDRSWDYEPLVEPDPCKSWWITEPQRQFWIVQSVAVFNKHVLPAASGFEEICVAWHPAPNDRDEIGRLESVRIKTFSHIDTDPLWSPHGQRLISALDRHKNGAPLGYDSIHAFDAICALVTDREGQFRRQSIQCLLEMTKTALTATGDDGVTLTEKYHGILAKNLSDAFLERLGVTDPDINSIGDIRDSWSDQAASEQNLRNIVNLRNELLGKDKANPGIVMRLRQAVEGISSGSQT